MLLVVFIQRPTTNIAPVGLSLLRKADVQSQKIG
jgi:hypothetical protein